MSLMRNLAALSPNLSARAWYCARILPSSSACRSNAAARDSRVTGFSGMIGRPSLSSRPHAVNPRALGHGPPWRLSEVTPVPWTVQARVVTRGEDFQSRVRFVIRVTQVTDKDSHFRTHGSYCVDAAATGAENPRRRPPTADCWRHGTPPSRPVRARRIVRGGSPRYPMGSVSRFAPAYRQQSFDRLAE